MAKKDIDLKRILQECRGGSRNSQRQLYEHFYGYAMSICLRFARNREEAAEILNDAFFKILTHLDQYQDDLPFRAWLRRILINAAVDYHRRNHRTPPNLDLDEAVGIAAEEIPLPELSATQDVLPVLQKLSPEYRMVFNLFVLEAFHHHEIAEMLDISPSTSRSNLVRAKEKLRLLMTETYLNNSLKLD